MDAVLLTAVAGKLMGLGVTVSVPGDTPVPVSDEVSVMVEMLLALLTLSVAAAGPAAVGSKAIPMVQFAAFARAEVQVLYERTNDDAFAPVTETVFVSGALPVLVRVKL
jgi:hypothetical protein